MEYLKNGFNNWMAEYWKQQKQIADMLLGLAKADQIEARKTISKGLMN
jgi:hypothetical protein